VSPAVSSCSLEAACARHPASWPTWGLTVRSQQQARAHYMGRRRLVRRARAARWARRERAARVSRDACVVTSSVRVGMGAVGRGRSAQAASSEQ